MHVSAGRELKAPFLVLLLTFAQETTLLSVLTAGRVE